MKLYGIGMKSPEYVTECSGKRETSTTITYPNCYEIWEGINFSDFNYDKGRFTSSLNELEKLHVRVPAKGWQDGIHYRQTEGGRVIVSELFFKEIKSEPYLDPQKPIEQMSDFPSSWTFDVLCPESEATYFGSLVYFSVSCTPKELLEKVPGVTIRFSECQDDLGEDREFKRSGIYNFIIIYDENLDELAQKLFPGCKNYKED